MENNVTNPFEIVIFQQRGSAEKKIKGIAQHGCGIYIKAIVNIDMTLPDFIDEPADYLPELPECELVLNYLKHPDLSEWLVSLCNQRKIPVIASGQRVKGAICPFTCCGLGKNRRAGRYGKQFGLPEFEVKLDCGIIKEIKVQKGAPCGATWQALEKVMAKLAAKSQDDIVSAMGREVQYLCAANPSAFDPVSGKSPLHFAGKAHAFSLRKAINMARKTKKTEQS